MRPILPYALSFAAGAMIYVVVEELIPESQLGKKYGCRHDGGDVRVCGDDDIRRRSRLMPTQKWHPSAQACVLALLKSSK